MLVRPECGAVPERDWEVERWERADCSAAGGSLLCSGWEAPCCPGLTPFPLITWAEMYSLLTEHRTHSTRGEFGLMSCIYYCRISGVLPCEFARVCVLLEALNEAEAESSASSGVGSGGGNWMLVKSGRDPPVLWAAGLSGVVSCWSGDGNMLQRTDGCCDKTVFNTSWKMSTNRIL